MGGETVANVKDVAAYILTKRGSMSAMKLEKLVYYSQAWHLVWEDKPLFDSRIEAWANGPVVPDLYKLHRGQFTVAASNIDGDRASLAPEEVSSIDAVLDFYGDMSAHELSNLTHQEDPWVCARQSAGLAPMQRGQVEIPLGVMQEYYLSLALVEDEQQ